MTVKNSSIGKALHYVAYCLLALAALDWLVMVIGTIWGLCTHPYGVAGLINSVRRALEGYEYGAPPVSAGAALRRYCLWWSYDLLLFGIWYVLRRISGRLRDEG